MNHACARLGTHYTLGATRSQAPLEMLDHLLDYTPPVTDPSAIKALDEASPDEILNDQLNTADWLEKMGAPTADEAEKSAASAAAQQAFGALVAQNPEQQRARW